MLPQPRSPRQPDSPGCLSLVLQQVKLVTISPVNSSSSPGSHPSMITGKLTIQTLCSVSSGQLSFASNTTSVKAAISHGAGIVIVATNNKLSLFQALAMRVVSLANIISAQDKVTNEASIFPSQEYPCPVCHCKHGVDLMTSLWPPALLSTPSVWSLAALTLTLSPWSPAHHWPSPHLHVITG